jgi:hypothetical protein
MRRPYAVARLPMRGFPHGLCPSDSMALVRTIRYEVPLAWTA